MWLNFVEFSVFKERDTAFTVTEMFCANINITHFVTRLAGNIAL